MTNQDATPAVFLTGAAGGIGLATARRLAAHGFRVYAGVRGEVSEPRSISRVELIECDVTKATSVAEAARQIDRNEHGRGLRAVINNAGVIVQGPLELVPSGEWRRQFEVNVFGPALVTSQFLPLLRAGQGRLINISATSARVALPFFGPVSASKAALESFSDAARSNSPHGGSRSSSSSQAPPGPPSSTRPPRRHTPRSRRSPPSSARSTNASSAPSRPQWPTSRCPRPSSSPP